MDSDQSDAAESLLLKLKDFSLTLSDPERAMLAALIAAGVAAAYDSDEVEGFDSEWSPGALPESLAAAIADRNLRVEGW